VILIVGGAAQLIPRLRQRAPRFHRWNGRIYVVAAFAASLAGLYLLWVRGTIGDLIQHLGVTLNAILIMLFAILAVRAAKSRRIDAHRRWALRLFLVVNGVWFFRVGLFLSFALNHGPFGFNPDTFRGPFITFLSFAQSLLPLAVLELYLRAQDAEAPARLAMAAALFVMAVATGIGVFALTMGMWLPAMRAA
jgi:Predicted membrane protein (DUF2306).